MSLSFAGVFADAGALWRRHRALLVPIAGVFFFLPGFALLLFVDGPAIDRATMSDEQVQSAVVNWLLATVHWQLGDMVVNLIGAAALLVLMLDRSAPTVGEAIVRGLRLLPLLLLAQLAVLAAFVLGLTLFILPGLYALGRLWLTSATLVDRPERGVAASLAAGVRLTENHGWMLLAVAMSVFTASYCAVSAGQALSVALTGWPVQIAIEALMAFAGSAFSVAQLLLQVAAYRRLAESKQGM